MKLKFQAYNAYDELLDFQEWDVQSYFNCEVQPYVMGVWVKDPDSNEPNRVIPLYLTQEQLDIAADAARVD